MKILFLCGSPRRRQSCSFTVASLAAQFLDPDIDVSFQDVSNLDLSPDASRKSTVLESVVTAMREADAVVWVFGCHVGFVPARMKLLLDHLLQHTEPAEFEGRWAGAVCTSGGLRDDAALEKLRFLLEELGFAYAGEISAAGNPGLFYDNDRETETSARRFAEIFNDLFRSGLNAPKRAKYAARKWLKPVKDDRQDNVSVSDKAPDRRKDKTPLLVISGVDYKLDPTARRWVDLIQRRYPGAVTILNMAGLNLEPCRACLWCNQFGDGRCIMNDDLTTVKKEMYRYRRWLIVTPAAGAAESYPLKVFLDRIWVDIHQAACAGKTGAAVIYGGGPTAFMVAEHIRRFMRLLGFHVADIIGDDGRDAVSNTADLDRIFHVMDLLEKDGGGPETYNLASDREGIKRIVRRWGYVLRSDYRYFCRNGLLSFREKWATRRLWWLMSTPRRFKKIVKLGRWSLGRKRDKRLQSVLKELHREKRSIELKDGLGEKS